jgi:hypothetical protein
VAVVTQLGVTLLASERDALEETTTESQEAYQSYLRGLQQLNAPDSSRRSYELAVQMFERAAALDPSYVAAHARLSEAHSSLYHYGFDRSASRLAKAWEGATRAREPPGPTTRSIP